MTGEEGVFTGGCLCGRIRYRVQGVPANQTHCHCETCRRASLDHPERVVPVDHIWTRRQIPWIKLADGLPRFAGNRDDGGE